MTWEENNFYLHEVLIGDKITGQVLIGQSYDTCPSRKRWLQVRKTGNSYWPGQDHLAFLVGREVMTSAPPIHEDWLPQGRQLLLAEQREKGKCASRTKPTAATARSTYTSS